ncbi:DEAD/DEAH box helicase [Aestuariivirga litoralis]|uniref:DEAD/DEAH box helicase n=1 Tax=Aestuariivirga litoralis TaxID=2650924 RepID=UPI0018C7155C|nr:DEAD/DEAH box helicase [Aestuariivirga litoralis]
MTQFTDLGLSQKLLDALNQEGYTTPTPIQAKSIPSLLEGRDLLGIAQTGTGKTAAFALPILERLSRHEDRVARGTCRVLILSPTRELAAQIGESFKTYGKYMKSSRAVVFGGTSIGKQVEMCRNGVDILVATPGRLVDLIERRAISLGKVEILVLDEVDQMLDLGFIHAIRKITALIPKTRQNLFFSATMPKEIAGLASGLLNNPVRVEIAPVATTAERVNQSVIHVDQPGKMAVLNDLLKDNNMTRTLVFTRTKHGADKVVRGLAQANYTAAAIHGNKSQPNREKALAGFKSGKILVLVATDIAARGIDVDGVSHVINFDLPHVPESYVHRIGRTARAGAEGQAIALCAGDERSLLRDIERTIRMSIPVTTHPLGKQEVPQGRETSTRPNGRAMAPKAGAREPRNMGDRPAREKSNGGRAHRGQPGFAVKPNAGRAAPGDRMDAPVQAHAETAAPARHVHDEKIATANKRTDWTPMQGEPTVMYQKPKAKEHVSNERPHQPWFNKRSENGANRGGKTRDRSFGDKPRGPRTEGGERRAHGTEKPWSNQGGEFAGDRARDERKAGDKPRGNFGDKPRGNFAGDKPRGNFGDKPRGDRNFSDKPRGERSLGDKPRGNFGDKPRDAGAGDRPRGNFGDKPRGNFAGGKPRSGSGGGKPGGFGRPSGGSFKRPNRAEG